GGWRTVLGGTLAPRSGDSIRPARPREGRPATGASRGPRCGDPDPGFPFYAVHSPSKTGVNALNDALCAGMSGRNGSAPRAYRTQRWRADSISPKSPRDLTPWRSGRG